ncbi:MAG: hypothetical protein ABIL00_06035 [candidate division WOR-3 bacterium]
MATKSDTIREAITGFLLRRMKIMPPIPMIIAMVALIGKRRAREKIIPSRIKTKSNHFLFIG